MRFCYSDPPYPGMSHLYKDHPDYAGEVDHKALIERMMDDFPDGWALSTASTTLLEVGALCPPDIRIAPWVKPFAIYKPNVNPAYAWEAVLFRGGRNRERYESTIPDWHAANVTLQRGCPGAKPESFCLWLFDLLNIQPGDELVDLFPGSGAVSCAWDKYQRQMPLPTTREKVPQLALDGAS